MSMVNSRNLLLEYLKENVWKYLKKRKKQWVKCRVWAVDWDEIWIYKKYADKYNGVFNPIAMTDFKYLNWNKNELLITEDIIKKYEEYMNKKINNMWWNRRRLFIEIYNKEWDLIFKHNSITALSQIIWMPIWNWTLSNPQKILELLKKNFPTLYRIKLTFYSWYVEEYFIK